MKYKIYVSFDSRKMATKCIGKVQKGTRCTKNAKPGTKWCGTHDPSAVRKKVLNKEEKAKKVDKIMLTMQLIQSKVGSDIDLNIDEEVKASSLLQQTKFVNSEFPKRIRGLALLERDVYPCANDCPFSRRIWMNISWHLISDLHSYENLAMTCKAIYKVLVTDKVPHYFSPLSGYIRSPRMYFMPIFRLVEFEVPQNLDSILVANKLPTLGTMRSVYVEKHGPPKDELERIQREGRMIMELVRELINVNLDPESEFEEELKGGGIMGNCKPTTKPIFHNCDIITKLVRIKGSTYVIAKCNDVRKFKSTEEKLISALKTFDGKRVIKLMRIVS